MKRITLLSGGGILILCSMLYAAVPQLINFQGILRDGSGNPVANGSYTVTFTIYDALTGGTNLWSEIQSVTTSGGLFTVLLGSTNPVPDSAFNNINRYLGIAVSPDPEMTPRQKLVSVAYGYRVNTVDSALGGTIKGDVNITGKATIGPGHTNSGGNAFVAGLNNTASGLFSTVTGGGGNVASGLLAAVSGGSYDTASAPNSTVSGGDRNSANGGLSTVSGGSNNVANGIASSIGGGSNNIAEDTASRVGGGWYNHARGIYSVVCGGGGSTAADSNSALGDYSSINGGLRNKATGFGSRVGGGDNNTASGLHAVVIGGAGSVASGPYAIVGGYFNTASNAGAHVGGGGNNVASGYNSVVGGGDSDTASSFSATVGGGYGNSASGSYSSGGGGGQNIASGLLATVGGGTNNVASNNQATVSGGRENRASGSYATVPGGYLNAARGDASFAVGFNAIAHNIASVVIAANGNFLSSDSIRSGGNEQIVLRADAGIWITNTGGVATYDVTKLINTSSGAYLTTGGTWTNASSRSYKTDIQPLRSSEYADFLEKLGKVEVVHFRYKTDPCREHIGMIAEDVPEEIASEDRQGVPTADAIAFLMAALKAQQGQIKKLEEKLKEMEGRTPQAEVK